MSVQNTPTAAGATQVPETTGGVYASLFEKINLHPVDALDDIDAWQDSQRLADASADERVTAAVRVFLERLKQSGQQVEKLDKTLLDHHIAELDRQISRQLDTVMHHPEFQQVESLWRGLKHLVNRTDYRQNVRTETSVLSRSPTTKTATTPASSRRTRRRNRRCTTRRTRRPTAASTRACRISSCCRASRTNRVWVVSDADSLIPENDAASDKQPDFDKVVSLSTPVKIKAGDSIGHLGFFELPTDSGRLSRYQVHIECLSTDDNLENFLTNPEKVGEDDPVCLKYDKDVPLMVPDAQGVMVDAQRNTRAPGRVEMSQLSAVDPDGHSVTDKKRAAYYEIEPEAGWLAAEKAEKISRYALAALGFTTLKSTTENFDLIDGIHHPAGVVKGILEQLYAAAQAETRSSYALNAFNYRRLLEQVDSNRDGHYSEEEYVQAIHNPSYRNQLFRLIVKHPGEWYYSKGDAPWKNYLDSLGEDAQAWRDYTEAFLDKIVWMKQVPEMVAEPWHMHPVMFLGALKQRKEKIIIFPLKVKPENDPGHIWSRFDWRNKHRANMAAFGANRQGNRKHAARDLYTKPYEEVVAICDGVVLDTRVFYCQTNQVTIRHQTKDGRYFIVRYGELDPESICISINNNVCQGQVIGKTGKLMDSGHPVVVRDGRIVFMLHFEYYSGEEGLNLMHSLTETSRLPYQRRRDLEDPLSILDEGFKNTFHENYQNERLDIINLKTSANGKLFIKSWESLGLEAYNDANGFCTIGYGHLIEKKRCEDIIISAQFQSGITEENAETLFNEDLIKYEEAVK